jgi:hypothetical protein
LPCKLHYSLHPAYRYQKVKQWGWLFQLHRFCFMQPQITGSTLVPNQPSGCVKFPLHALREGGVSSDSTCRNSTQLTADMQTSPLPPISLPTVAQLNHLHFVPKSPDSGSSMEIDVGYHINRYLLVGISEFAPCRCRSVVQMQLSEFPRSCHARHLINRLFGGQAWKQCGWFA